MEFWSAVWAVLMPTWPEIVAVVIASCVLYLTFTAVLRFWGQRLFANRSGTGLAVALVLGAIVGRSMLGPLATLGGGLVCLATLVMLEGFFGAGRRSGLIGHRRAIVLYADGKLDSEVMARYHLNERMLFARLRKAGVSHLDEVRAVLLEPDGSMSLLRTGTHLDPRLVRDVTGGERLLTD
ncbi:MAG: DUF421 domain-containing protein [Acidobacteriota bacterium]|nr:DUF421 domain-containing protein [Acidobacteriota bacterium]